ncbi:hypothetical protein C8Q72DRAFT_838797 [Fomitopsis betulina]|nr:hypothetical protein C8Q72DRAFT_838797 [Fomitopsis betulina]
MIHQVLHTSMVSRKEREREKARITARTTFNALSPISQLPPEILSEVFLRHAGQRTDYSRHQQCLRDRICVTHVCAHWREVALQFTSSLEPSRRFVSDNCAVGAFGAIEGRASVDVEKSDDSLILLFSNLHRMRQLSVWMPLDTPDAVLEGISGPAPLPESYKNCLRNNQILSFPSLGFSRIPRAAVSGVL